MKTIVTQCLSAMIALTFPAAISQAEEPKAGAKDDNKLVGTWKLVSAKWGGTERKNEGLTILKHVTQSQFMWVRYDEDGNVKHAMGGGYTLKGEDYEETTEYGTGSGDFTAMKGKKHSFKVKVDGNKLHQNGKLNSGLTIEEVWERVEKK
jgi:hypothetical protein